MQCMCMCMVRLMDIVGQRPGGSGDKMAADGKRSGRELEHLTSLTIGGRCCVFWPRAVDFLWGPSQVPAQ